MTTGPNAEQIRFWNEIAGPKWVRFQKMLDDHIGPIGHHAMDRAAVAPGERVLDVGCGCGTTTRELGRRVGPRGDVVGIDISEPMLARAREVARETGAENVRFERTDAQTHRFPAGAFDLAWSRFGVMFFTDPAAAFANLRTALVPRGRLAFVCWQSLPQNAWLFVPLRAAAQHLTLPPPAPDVPGPFSFADPDRVRDVLARGGFVDVDIEPLDGTLALGGGASLDEVVGFLMEGVGPTSAALREADPAVRPRVADAIRAALAPFATRAGIQLGFAAWIVRARTAG